MAKAQFKTGDKARVKNTGIDVTISEISGHGFAVVKYECGYQRMLLTSQLEAVKERASVRTVKAA